MKAHLEAAQLLGEMASSLDSADYHARVKAVIAALADEASQRERLWATVAKLNGVAQRGLGLIDQSSETGEATTNDVYNRVLEWYKGACDFAPLVPLTKAAP